MATNLTSFHISYNARHLKPEEVAKTFIYNDDFEELIQDNHTVLLGARGCGKTTLMKMLTLPALYSWEDSNAKNIRDKISFYSVYISTDIYWNAKKDAYNKQLINFPKYSEVVSKVAVTTNVLFSLCETFENILKHESLRDEGKEIELSKALIKEWVLPPTIPALALIKEALIRRTDFLNRHIQRAVFNCKNDEEVELKDEFFVLDFDSSVLLAVNIFERIFGLLSSCKWALCFDELELAPDWLQERLFNSLRSRNQKILYKLSASPIVSVSPSLSATPGNDLRLIKMWPHGKNDKYREFSEALVKSVLNARFGQAIDPESIFGTNPLFNKSVENDYQEGGETWQQIKDLAEVDAELKQILIKESIDPENPVDVTPDSKKMDVLLRKIKPIVYFKSYYKQYRDTPSKRKTRTRKAATLFYGKEVIYKICDGNPRWLIGIINAILQKNDSGRKISEIDQANALLEVAKQFNNVIKTIPEAIIERKNKVITLSGILKEIGDHIFDEIVIGEFITDPHSTFVIDAGIDDDHIRILEKGVYQGAIILVDPSENAFDFEMKKKRFRLSYLFCPMFKIPIRSYTAFSLSKCLTGRESIDNPQTEIGFIDSQEQNED